MKNPKSSEWKEREDYRKKILADEEDLGSEGNLLQVVEVAPGNHVKPHFHEKTTEVFYILQSGGKLVIDGEEIAPEEGEVIVCEPGDVHEVFNDSDQVFRILVFKVGLEEEDTIWR
ncbi:MAG: cupin domain-containing protein [Candidatus Nanohaloarchaea archaeon]|nr:cupin domain-containing protein [Candidatus Nanohaloarchaea archaeon]